jgi:hypothetical protein
MIGRDAMERFFSDNDATSQFLEHLDNSIVRVRYSPVEPPKSCDKPVRMLNSWRVKCCDFTEV